MNSVKASVVGLAAIILTGCSNTPKNVVVPQNYTPPVQSNIPVQPQISVEPSKDKILEEVIEETPKKEPKPKIDLSIPRYFHTLTPEFKALLDILSWAEYTSPPCRGDVSSYQILVIGYHIEDPNKRFGARFGNWDKKPKKEDDKCKGHYFVGWKDHPGIEVSWRKGSPTSQAAGRYQWMLDTYNDLKKRKNCGPSKDQDCGLFKTGIYPDEQDKAAKYLSIERGVTQEILETAVSDQHFKKVWKKLASTWASLPYYDWGGRGYGYYKSQRNNCKQFKPLKEEFMKAYNKYRVKDTPVILPNS